MAGAQLNTYGVGDVNLTNVMEVLDAMRQGYHKVSLTNMATTDEPEIAAGSLIEINGALFSFENDEAITGSPTDGDVYIKLTPSGSSVTAAFTNTPPTWDDEKGGWYESGTNNRYINFRMWLDSAAYYNKIEFINSGIAKSNTEIDVFTIDENPSTANSLVSVATDASASTEFYLRYPITAYLTLYDSVTHRASSYGLVLNPGRYKMYASADYDCHLDIYQNSTYTNIYNVVTGLTSTICYLMLTGIHGLNITSTPIAYIRNRVIEAV